MADETPVRALRDVRQDQPHLLDYVRVLLRRKYLVIFVFSLVIFGTVAYLRATVPVYEAHARLIIEARSPDTAGPVGNPSDQSKTQQDYQTHYQLLQSRNLARKTIEVLGLWGDPRLNPALRPPDDSVYAQVRTQARAVFRMITRRPEPEEATELPPPPDPREPPQPAGPQPVEPQQLAAPPDLSPSPDTDVPRTQDRTINAFLSNLSVMPVQNSRLLDVSFRATDAALAATVVNGLASNYIAQDVDSRSVETRETSAWLTEQIEEQRKQVAAAEDALQRYRERTGDVTVESGANIVVQKLADLNAAVTKAKTDRLERESIYQQVAGVANQPDALASIPAVLANGFVQQQRAELVTLLREEAQLADRLGERHPEMIKVRLAIKTTEEKLRAAIQDVVQSLRRDYDSAMAQESSLTSALNEQKAEAQSMNRKAIDLAVLQRDVENAKAVYDSLVQQGRQAAVSEDRSTISPVRIVDRAVVPDQPISPKRRQILLMALLGALFVSVSAAFFVEYLDSRVKTQEEVEIHLRLTSLGAIPRLSRKSQRAFAKNRLSQTAVPSSFAEAFHGLRANVLFSSPDAGPCSIVVTSASPREGKTIIAANLAVGLAQAGHRVILVDADLRQPRMHDLFGLDLEPGLSNLINGVADAKAAVRPTRIPNLSVLTAGAHPPNPAELVGSHRFGELLSFLEKEGDIVVIDTPPVMAVADAAILAHRTSGVLFVVAADTTSRHAAQSALEQLERAKGRFLGAVLNRVDNERDKYRYASYSRSYRSKTNARTPVLH